jgi:3-phenylpropionate/trans-cinnamate dioxygenase ferredoxin reductase subunit
VRHSPTTCWRLPVELGANAVNVHTLRSLSDARKLRDAFTLGGHLLVVGGGYIGLETAAVARRLGMRVTLIEQAERILQRVAAGETADYFRALHRAEGVEIFEGVGLESVDQVDGRVVRARLSNGETLPVDVIVAGIGVVPHTDLAAAAGLAIDNGIAVDSAGRTRDPAIFAAGDCASFPYAGRRIRLESVQNAIDQAEVVAEAMMNFPAEYRPTPWFWSDQYATKLQIAGLNHGFTRVVRRPGTRDGISVWYFAGEEFLAVDAINDPKAFMTARQWLAAGRKPRFADLADPSRELGAIATP